MKRATFVISLALSAVTAAAQTEIPVTEPLSAIDRWRADPTISFTAVDIDLQDFLWQARPLVIFADAEADPAFQRQIELLASRPEDLAERDVVVIVDTDPAGGSELRERLRPRGFMLVLIGKDGGVKLRKPFPWDVRELSRVIDKSPIRQQEIRDRRNLNQ